MALARPAKGVYSREGDKSTRGRGELAVEGRKTVRPRGTDEAKVIQVIRTKSLRGAGTENDMCREVLQYWDLDGTFLAEYDPSLGNPGVEKNGEKND